MKKIHLNTQQNTKDKIRSIVGEYIKLFPQEFQAWKKGIQPKKDAIELTNPFGEMKGDDVIQQMMVEMPETLYGLIKQGLTQDEWDWLFSHGRYAGSKEKGDAKHDGLKWFAREFPVFRLAKI